MENEKIILDFVNSLSPQERDELKGVDLHLCELINGTFTKVSRKLEQPFNTNIERMILLHDKIDGIISPIGVGMY